MLLQHRSIARLSQTSSFILIENAQGLMGQWPLPSGNSGTRHYHIEKFSSTNGHWTPQGLTTFMLSATATPSATILYRVQIAPTNTTVSSNMSNPCFSTAGSTDGILALRTPSTTGPRLHGETIPTKKPLTPVESLLLRTRNFRCRNITITSWKSKNHVIALSKSTNDKEKFL